MLYKLSKTLLVMALSLTYITGYGQFTNDTKLWYDLRGKPKSCLTISYNRISKSPGSLKMNSYNKVIFNKEGQIIERYYAGTVNYGNIDDEYKHTYKYDNKGNITEMVNYDANGRPESKFEFTYSADKKLYLLKRYDLTEIDMPRILYGFKVDASGRILDQYQYNESLVPDAKYQFGRTEYGYNNHGVRVEETRFDLDGAAKSKRFMKYDQYNDMLESIDSVSNIPTRNTTLVFDYPKYDKQHNWLIKNRAVNGKPHSVEKRYITYYK